MQKKRQIEMGQYQKPERWLNMAELEIGILSRQCLNRRVAGIAEMRDEAGAWVTTRNSQKTAKDPASLFQARRECARITKQNP
jgi:hypothetical protein